MVNVELDFSFNMNFELYMNFRLEFDFRFFLQLRTAQNRSGTFNHNVRESRSKPKGSPDTAPNN
jgi:hypothetical protein